MTRRWVLAGAIAFGAELSIVSDRFPTKLGLLGPYGFSPALYAALVGAAILYARGEAAGPRSSGADRLLFATGLALLGAVLQTRFEYVAQHMFAMTRMLHLVTHHLAPFLIALSWPWPAIARGMPDRVRRMALRPRSVAIASLGAVFRAVQHPLPASTLFVGLIALWLVPQIHFRAMLDPSLYAVMNWSMAVDGLLFWSMILAPAGVGPSLPIRLLLCFAIEIPQIMIGAFVAHVGVDLYPSYTLCGRLLPAIGPTVDQDIGGFIISTPAGMMSAVAVLILLRRLRAGERTTGPLTRRFGEPARSDGALPGATT